MNWFQDRAEPTAIAPPCLEDFLQGYVRAGVPVVIKGLASGWLAVARWTPAYLAQATARMGDIEVPYRSTPDHMPRMDLARIHRGSMSLLDILRDCAASPAEGEEIYVPGVDLPMGAPLAQDIELPALLATLGVYGTTVFLGRNTKCVGHFHAKTQALLCQVQGVKRIWMFPPSRLGRLYLFPVWSRGFFQSQVNFYGDLSAFPKLARGGSRLLELHPGDALFIPLHWLHVPQGDGWTVSVTHWWRPARGEWFRSAGAVRALLGIGFELVRRLGFSTLAALRARLSVQA